MGNLRKTKYVGRKCDLLKIDFPMFAGTMLRTPSAAEIKRGIQFDKRRAKENLQLEKKRAKQGITNLEVDDVEVPCTLQKLSLTYKGHHIEVTPYAICDDLLNSHLELKIDGIEINLGKLDDDAAFAEEWCDFERYPRNVEVPEWQTFVLEIVDAYLAMEAV